MVHGIVPRFVRRIGHVSTAPKKKFTQNVRSQSLLAKELYQHFEFYPSQKLNDSDAADPLVIAMPTPMTCRRSRCSDM
jgi:hypothetical protein